MTTQTNLEHIIRTLIILSNNGTLHLLMLDYQWTRLSTISEHLIPDTIDERAPVLPSIQNLRDQFLMI
jgi:hypothetical protein